MSDDSGKVIELRREDLEDVELDFDEPCEFHFKVRKIEQDYEKICVELNNVTRRMKRDMWCYAVMGVIIVAVTIIF